MKKGLVILPICFYILFYFHNTANTEEILASFNKQTVTVSEYELLRHVPRKGRPRPISKSEKEEFLDDIITASLVAPLVAPKISDRKIDAGYTVEQKVKAFSEYTLDLLLRKKIVKETKINKSNYQDYIPTHGGEKVRFREITVRNKVEAEEILKNILNGKDFESLAREKSINKNSIKGGDTGFVNIGKGGYPKDVDNIIYNLKIGDISEILKTFEGYTIFKSIEMKDLTNQETEELIQNLQWTLIKEKTNSLLRELRSKANIEIKSENIKTISQLDSLDSNALQIELAKVNKTIIRLIDLVNKVKGPIDPSKSIRFRAITNIENMLTNEIDELLLVSEAKRIALDRDPIFQNAVRRFKEIWYTDIYINNILLNGVTCSEQEIQNFYNEYKKDPRYQNHPALIRARHILLDDEDYALKILKQLKGGANFAEMARNYSIYRLTSIIDGDLGYLERGQMMTKEEEEAVFKLSEGQISEIIKSRPPIVQRSSSEADQFVYNIFKLEDKIDEGEKDYNKVKKMVEFKLLMKKRKEIIDNFIIPLKEKANIEKNLDFL